MNKKDMLLTKRENKIIMNIGKALYELRNEVVYCKEKEKYVFDIVVNMVNGFTKPMPFIPFN